MTDQLAERLRAAAPTPRPVDFDHLRGRAARTSGARLAAMAVAAGVVVVIMGVLVRPGQVSDVELAPGSDLPAAVLAEPPTGDDPRLPADLSGVDVENLRLVVERDDMAVFVDPVTDNRRDVCLYLLVGEEFTDACQQLDASPILAQVPYAESSREVVAALVADGYTQAVLADNRVVAVTDNVLLVSGPPPMDQRVTLRGPAGEATANLGARNTAGPTAPADAVDRVAEVCGSDAIGPPGARPPSGPQLSATVVEMADGNPRAEPFGDNTAYGLPPLGPPPEWMPWLHIDPIARLEDANLELVRIDGPNQGLCAILQSAAADPGARAVQVADTTGIVANDRNLLWLAAPDLMLQLGTSGDPIADDALVDIAGRVTLQSARDVAGELPADIGLAIRGDGRLDIITATDHTTYRHPLAFAPGDEPDSLARIGDVLISYGQNTYALTPGAEQPEQIGESTYFLPTGKRDAVWLISGNLSFDVPNTATLIDSAGNVLTGPHTMPADTAVDAAIGEGLLLSGTPGTGRAYWTPEAGARPIGVGEITIATRGDRFATCHNRCSELAVYTIPAPPSSAAAEAIADLIAGPTFEGSFIGTGAFSPDGQRLAVTTGSPQADVDILVVDIERAQSYTFDLGFRDIPEVGFGTNGQLVAVGDGQIVVIDGQNSVTRRLPDDIDLVKDVVVMATDLADQFQR